MTFNRLRQIFRSYLDPTLTLRVEDYAVSSKICKAAQENASYKEGCKVVVNPWLCCPPAKSARAFCWGDVKTASLLLLAFTMSLCVSWPQVKARRVFGIGRCWGALRTESSTTSSAGPCRACASHLHSREAEDVLGEGWWEAVLSKLPVQGLQAL